MEWNLKQAQLITTEEGNDQKCNDSSAKFPEARNDSR